MREIKFRAWDEDNEIMYYSDQDYENCFFGFDKGVVVAWLRQTEPQTLDEPAHDYGKPIGVMQFTGLKDKNGKEIYKSDEVIEIFRDYFETSDRIPEDCQGRCKQEDIYTGIVIWWDFGWFLDTKEHGHIALTDDSDELEVIDNIHENPELLEEKLK